MTQKATFRPTSSAGAVAKYFDVHVYIYVCVSVSICLSVCLIVREHISGPIFLCMLPMPQYATQAQIESGKF